MRLRGSSLGLRSCGIELNRKGALRAPFLIVSEVLRLGDAHLFGSLNTDHGAEVRAVNVVDFIAAHAPCLL